MKPFRYSSFAIFLLVISSNPINASENNNIERQTVWQGKCSQGNAEYGMIMKVAESKEDEITGNLEWPIIKCKTKFKGTVKNNNISFTEYEIIEGSGVVLPTLYSGEVTKDVIKGNWYFQKCSGRFQLEKTTKPNSEKNINLLNSSSVAVSKDSSIIMLGDLSSTNNAEPFSEDLRKRAEAGDEKAQYDLGLSYFNGLGVAKDEQEAKKWFSKAGLKTKNNMLSLLNLKEEEYSEELVKKAKNGDHTSQCALGMCLLRGSFGLKSLQKEGLDLLEESAEGGNANAQYLLGQFFMYGLLGAEKNITKAFELTQKSAEQGNAAGQLALGAFYLAGIGVDKNQVEAIKWIETSAKQGFQPAQTLYDMVRKTRSPHSATNPH